MCCTRLAANAGPKKVAKIAIWAPSHNFVGLYLRNYGTYWQWEKIVKQQYLPYTSSQYGELRPTSGWDRFVSLGTPGNFNGFRVLAALLHGTLVVGVSQTAAFNRGRHLYSAGRPSRWALAHISSPSYPTDSHQSSDDVYWRGGGWSTVRWARNLFLRLPVGRILEIGQHFGKVGGKNNSIFFREHGV